MVVRVIMLALQLINNVISEINERNLKVNRWSRYLRRKTKGESTRTPLTTTTCWLSKSTLTSDMSLKLFPLDRSMLITFTYLLINLQLFIFASSYLLEGLVSSCASHFIQGSTFWYVVSYLDVCQCACRINCTTVRNLFWASYWSSSWTLRFWNTGITHPVLSWLCSSKTWRKSFCCLRFRRKGEWEDIYFLLIKFHCVGE